MEIEFDLNYFKAEININNGDQLKILDEGKEDDGKYGKRYVFKALNLTTAQEASITPNTTSLQRMAKAWGKDSKEWVGKVVDVEIFSQMVSGEKKDVIYLRPVEKQEKQEQVDKQKEQLKKDKKMDDDIPVVEDEGTEGETPPGE